MNFRDRFKYLLFFSKPLKKWHNFLCTKSKSYHRWHQNPYHKHVHFSILSLVIVLFLSLILNAIPGKTRAAYAFVANFDNSSLDASYSVGTNPAYYDTQPATVVTPGKNGTGGAALVNGNQQLKYRLRNNVDTATGEIQMDFQAPYTTTGTDNSVGKFYYNRKIFYDSASAYYYISDYYNHRIIKTKIDGTGWTVLGSFGNGIDQFYYPNGIYYDASTDFIYVADTSNNRIVRTKIDGTGWSTFGVGGSTGIGKFSAPYDLDYDAASGYLYIADYGNFRLVKTKFDGTGWTTLGSSTITDPHRGGYFGINYDPIGDYIYTTDYLNHRIIKTKIDGTGWTVLGTQGSGAGQFYLPTGIHYDSNDDSVIVADYGNSRIVKTKIDGTGWATYGASGSGVGKFSSASGLDFDPATNFIYVSDYGNSRIVKTKIDGTGWATYGTVGWAEGNFIPTGHIYYDKSSDFVYIADTTNNRIVKTKMDGTGWTTFGAYGSGTNQFNSPSAIYYDSNSDYLYISDRSNNRIVKTKIDGTGWTTFGAYGSGTGKFNSPYDLVYDSTTDFIYIADYSNHRIVKTKIDGTGWTTFGASGSGTAQFNAPYSLDYDSASGYIYVADYSNHRIVKTKIDGTGWTTFGGPTYGNGINQFYYPAGISYDSSTGDIYVADNSNSRIVKTHMDGSGWATYGTSGSFYSTGHLSAARDVFFDNVNGDMYVVDYSTGGRIVKTKWDNSGWTVLDGSQKKTLLTTSGTNPMTIELIPNMSRLKFTISAGAVPAIVYSNPVNFTSGSWYNLRATYNNSTGVVEIYVDNALIGSGTFTPWASLTNLGYYFYIASSPIMPSYSLGTLVDNVQISTLNVDTTPPTNPTTVAVTSDSNTVKNGEWNSYQKLNFTWPSGQDEAEGSGVDGYLIYYGTDPSGDPLFSKNFTASNSYTSNVEMENDQSYYFRIRTRDLARNYSEPITLFTYKYDNHPPDKIEYINIDKPGCQIAQSFTLTWPKASDTQGGVAKDVAGYEYKLGSDGKTTFTTDTQATVSPYQEGENVFYVRSKDDGGNYSDWQTLVFCTTGITSILTGPTVTTEPTTLDISWVSSKQTTSYVKLDDGTQQGKSELTQVHKVTLVGLEPQRKYKYKLVWKDASNNDGESDWFETNTKQARVIMNPQIINVSPYTATADFGTSDLASATLKYGVGNFDTIKIIDGQATKFTQQLDGLSPGTAYQLIIEARSSDSQPYYASVTFTTLPYPKVSNITFNYLKDVKAAVQVQWQTNLETTSIVNYKSASSSAWITVSSAELTANHSMTIPNLDDNTSYDVRVGGMDKNGNSCLSDNQSYKTPFDTRPPAISNFSYEVKAGSADSSKSELVVSWETDELSTSQIEYSDGISGDEYNFKTNEDTDVTKNHVVIINGLDQAKIYHIKAISKDSSGNSAFGEDTTVITSSAQQSVVTVIMNSLQKTMGWAFKFLK